MRYSVSVTDLSNLSIKRGWNCVLLLLPYLYSTAQPAVVDVGAEIDENIYG